MYEYKVEAAPTRSKTAEAQMNHAAHEGWELVAVDNGQMYWRRRRNG